jgi:hypothetical protein
MGEEAAQGFCDFYAGLISQMPEPKSVRIRVKPEWVGINDFQTRFPPMLGRMWGQRPRDFDEQSIASGPRVERPVRVHASDCLLPSLFVAAVLVACRHRATNRPVIVPAVAKNGESAKRVRRRHQVQNVTKIG